MKKVIYKILFVILFALLINCIFIQENYAATLKNDFNDLCDEAEKLDSSWIRIIVEQNGNRSKTTDIYADVVGEGKKQNGKTICTYNIDFTNLKLKKIKDTRIFIYYEQISLKNLEVTIDKCKYKKEIDEIQKGGNNAYAGLLLISEFKTFTRENLKDKYYKEYPKVTLKLIREKYEIHIEMKFDIEPYYETYKEEVLDQAKNDEGKNKWGIFGIKYPVEDKNGDGKTDEKDAVIIMEEIIPGRLDGYVWSKTEEKEFVDLAGGRVKNKAYNYYAEDRKEEKKYAMALNFFYFPDEQMILQYQDKTDITDQINEDMTQEEINEIVNNEADVLHNEMNEVFLKAIVQQLEGEDRWEIVFNDILKDINNYLPGDGDGMTEEDKKEVSSKASIALTVITYIGTVASVVMLGVIGIKYMLGSVEQRADYKQDLVPYVVGAVMLFGISTIAEILKLIGENINNI